VQAEAREDERVTNVGAGHDPCSRGPHEGHDLPESSVHRGRRTEPARPEVCGLLEVRPPVPLLLGGHVSEAWIVEPAGIPDPFVHLERDKRGNVPGSILHESGGDGPAPFLAEGIEQREVMVQGAPLAQLGLQPGTQLVFPLRALLLETPEVLHAPLARVRGLRSPYGERDVSGNGNPLPSRFICEREVRLAREPRIRFQQVHAALLHPAHQGTGLSRCRRPFHARGLSPGRAQDHGAGGHDARSHERAGGDLTAPVQHVLEGRLQLVAGSEAVRRHIPYARHAVGKVERQESFARDPVRGRVDVHVPESRDEIFPSGRHHPRPGGNGDAAGRPDVRDAVACHHDRLPA
jgi:hypothetical protein